MEVRKPQVKEANRLYKLEEDHFHDIKSVRISPSSLQRHLVAFANADGGEIYVGVEDKKIQGERIVGFKSIESANNHIKVCMEETKPSIDNIDLEFIDFGQKGYILHILIPKSPRVHYTSGDECYVRLNANSVKITGEKVLQLGYAKGQYSYESVAVDNLELEDILNSQFLSSYMTRVETTLDPYTFLRKQRLLSKKGDQWLPNVGCILLFGEEPQAALTTKCTIKVYRLQTSTTEYRREHLKGAPVTINGPIEQQIYKVIETVNDFLKDARYREGGQLVRLKYPSEALKEILVNAVIHRDYSLNDDIHVRIYDNRVEIQSPGRLPGYITTQNILNERYSRNSNIVRLLNKLPNPLNHDIGEGLNTAFNEMRKAGLVAPEICELDNAVLVTIKHQKLASIEDQVIEYLKSHSVVTNKDIRKLTGEESENRVKKAFQRLRDKGEIEPVDSKASPFQYKWKRRQRS